MESLGRLIYRYPVDQKIAIRLWISLSLPEEQYKNSNYCGGGDKNAVPRNGTEHHHAPSVLSAHETNNNGKETNGTHSLS
jgi:hypothetical protein